MKLLKILIGIFLFLNITPSIAQSPPYYNWRYEKVTTCNTLTNGSFADLCHQNSDNTLWMCVPTSGMNGVCNTSSQWIQVVGAAPINPVINTATQSSTISITVTNANGQIFSITGLAQGTTISVTGTPVNGEMIEIQVTDNGTARSLSWGSGINSSTVTLPTTTVISTLLHIMFQYDSTSGDWFCIGVA